MRDRALPILQQLTLMLKLATFFKPADALLDLACDLFDLRHVAFVQVKGKLVKKRVDWRVMRMQQRGHVVFIQTDARKVPLAIKRRKRVEFQQNQALDGGARNLLLDKTLHRCVVLAHLVEEKVSGKEHVNF